MIVRTMSLKMKMMKTLKVRTMGLMSIIIHKMKMMKTLKVRTMSLKVVMKMSLTLMTMIGGRI